MCTTSMHFSIGDCVFTLFLDPNLVPFFSLLLIFLLWRYAIKRQAKDLLCIGLVSGLVFSSIIYFHFDCDECIVGHWG